MGYPMVGFGLNYTVVQKSEMSTSAMNGKDMVMPMITLTLPVYRKKYKAMQAEAELLRSASAQNYQSTKNSLQVEYNDAVREYEDARRKIVLYTRQSALANGSLLIQMNRFSVAGTGLSDLLRSRQQTLEYELKKLDALTDLHIAVARIKKLISKDCSDLPREIKTK